jgi:hypothetical protein
MTDLNGQRKALHCVFIGQPLPLATNNEKVRFTDFAAKVLRRKHVAVAWRKRVFSCPTQDDGREMVFR